MNSVILPIHIAAGGLAIVLGAVALSVKKGGTIHRRSGLLFVCAMLVMGFTASILGLLKSPNDPNVTAGITISYFVVTALMTVRPVSRWTTAIHVVAVTVAALFAYGSFLKGVTAFQNAGGSLNGVPFPMHFLFAAVFSLAAVGDLRRVTRRSSAKSISRRSRTIHTTRSW